MRAPGTSRRRGSSRAVRARLLAALIGFVTVLTVAVALPSVALADPPPPSCPSSGPCLVLDDDRGHASTKVVAHYWFVGASGVGCNGYTDARLTWDDDIIVPTKALDTTDPKYCTVDFSGFAPPKPAAFGGHRVTVSACYVDLPFVGCDQPGSIVTQTYTIDPIPTLVVKPKSGRVTTDLSATFDLNSSQCAFAEAQFYWDGKTLGGRVPLDKASCSVTYSLANAPKPNAVGGHTISARACSRTCLPYWGASASYTVLVTPTPTPTAQPTPTPTPTADADADPDDRPVREPRSLGVAGAFVRILAVGRAQPVSIR